MLDRLDLALLDQMQIDAGQTAEQLARTVPLSPSAIARRLRRLRAEGWIARTVGLLSPKLTASRLRALCFIQLSEHADHKGKEALRTRLVASPHVQFCYEMTGAFDMLAMIDCASMAEYNELADQLLTTDPTVRRYETSFVKRELKFKPFVALSAKV